MNTEYVPANFEAQSSTVICDRGMGVVSICHKHTPNCGIPLCAGANKENKKTRGIRVPFALPSVLVTDPVPQKLVPAHADFGSQPAPGLLPPTRAFPNLPAPG